MDGSGTVRDTTERHFVLAGIAVFERQIYHLIRNLDEFVSGLALGPQPDDIELHASVISGGRRGVWAGMMRRERLKIIERGLDLLRNAHWSVAAFAVAVDKTAMHPDDPVERAFEEMCNRFNLFLSRSMSRDDPHRGLLVMDKSRYEGTLQAMANEFRVAGARWGRLRNLAEVPMFVDSRASRIIQLADLLSWAVWRRYERADATYFDRIARRFDRTRSGLHGLLHLTNDRACTCPACEQQGARGMSSHVQ